MLSKLIISSKYGNRRYYNNKLGKYISDFHNGVDITNYANIICFFKGKVTEVRNNINGFYTQYSAGLMDFVVGVIGHAKTGFGILAG